MQLCYLEHEPPCGSRKETDNEKDSRPLQQPAATIGSVTVSRSDRCCRPAATVQHAAPSSCSTMRVRRVQAGRRPRGVGQHPHRGSRRSPSSTRARSSIATRPATAALIGPGDVQWMTAASGILHEEFHSKEFTRKGGTLEMVQLWVNLPRKDKKEPPGYQTLLNRGIPSVALPDGAGTVRVIAGDYQGQQGTGADVHADQHLGRAPRAGQDTTLTLAGRAYGRTCRPARNGSPQ